MSTDTFSTPRSPITPARGRRYVLISPCRDEEKFMRVTLDAGFNQTEPPALWVVVDDGSKDATPQILREYEAKHPNLKIVTRGDRGDRKLGGGVIETFDTGLATVDLSQYDYVCKLDLDLDLPPEYFARCMDAMEADPRLSAFSGKPYFEKDGAMVSEKCGDEHCVGMAKFYRTSAFKEMGGFVREIMWDGIDTHRTRQLGWRAESRDGHGLRFTHLRPMGTSHKNWWTGRVRHGFGQYYMGTQPLYMLASLVFRAAHPPILMGSAAMGWGYLKSWITRQPRYGTPEFRKFLRKYQWACLIQGKDRATRELDQKQAQVWSSTHPGSR